MHRCKRLEIKEFASILMKVISVLNLTPAFTTMKTTLLDLNIILTAECLMNLIALIIFIVIRSVRKNFNWKAVTAKYGNIFTGRSNQYVKTYKCQIFFTVFYLTCNLFLLKRHCSVVYSVVWVTSPVLLLNRTHLLKFYIVFSSVQY